MNLILWIALGALAGFVARLIIGSFAGVWWQDILLGIVGAVVGGFVASLLGLGAVTGFNLYSLLIAIGGACLVLLLLSWLRRF